MTPVLKTSRRHLLYIKHNTVINTSVADPYHFDLDQGPRIRIGEKRIRIRLWIRPRPKIEENFNFFS